MHFLAFNMVSRVTMFAREFQVVGAEQQKARPEKEVLWNGYIPYLI